MGKAAGYVVFGILFIVFVLVKLIISNGKKAYETVFDPHSFKNESHVRRELEVAALKMDIYLTENNITSSSSSHELFVALKNIALICHKHLHEVKIPIDVPFSFELASEYLSSSRGISQDYINDLLNEKK